ncbi:MAG TPA: hypothetical protein VM387_14010 [Gemmatimonadales bacterium]|jgi:hypothetical protein|nr:hypothetical protein [Gemmatimonadales bacterium]
MSELLQQALCRPKDQRLVIDHYDPAPHWLGLHTGIVLSTIVRRGVVPAGEILVNDRGSERCA